uniref:GTP-binding protein Rheb isoform X3 n=1 Tax=Scatophagus argus TaxID=75038 RepID=UPI001ED7EE3F|nr:GTP-binding protein Rheb isoform X3 [Scatophagus argus]
MPQPKSRKIAVLGYRSVGKSSLTIQFVEGQFVDSYDPTIENTFTKTMTVNGQEYNLQLVDTAGQDEYSIFPQSYTIDVDGYILIYSVTSYKSFEVVRVIHEKLLDMSTNHFSWEQERLTHGEGDRFRGRESSGGVVERCLPRVFGQRKPGVQYSLLLLVRVSEHTVDVMKLDPLSVT